MIHIEEQGIIVRERGDCDRGHFMIELPSIHEDELVDTSVVYLDIFALRRLAKVASIAVGVHERQNPRMDAGGLKSCCDDEADECEKTMPTRGYRGGRGHRRK